MPLFLQYTSEPPFKPIILYAKRFGDQPSLLLFMAFIIAAKLFVFSFHISTTLLAYARHGQNGERMNVMFALWAPILSPQLFPPIANVAMHFFTRSITADFFNLS